MAWAQASAILYGGVNSGAMPRGGPDALARDERALVDAVISQGGPYAETLDRFFRELVRPLWGRGPTLKSKWKVEPSQDIYPGTAAIAGTVVRDVTGSCLLELVTERGIPSYFARTKSRREDIGSSRIYETLDPRMRRVDEATIHQALGAVPIVAGSLVASPPAQPDAIEDLEWRLGCPIPHSLLGLLRVHATVETENDLVWTVSPIPAMNPKRSFFVFGSTGSLLRMLTADKEFGEVGFRLDYLGRLDDEGFDYVAACKALWRDTLDD